MADVTVLELEAQALNSVKQNHGFEEIFISVMYSSILNRKLLNHRFMYHEQVVKMGSEFEQEVVFEKLLGEQMVATLCSRVFINTVKALTGILRFD